jgi:L-2,4-diaminobutyrate decarboxylase
MSAPGEVTLSRAHVLSPQTVSDFKNHLDELVDRCLDFKAADPHVVTPAAMDRDRLRSAAAVTDDGVELSDLIARFAAEVLPASLNFSAAGFLAHPDAGNSSAGVLGDVANAFLQQNLSSFDYAPAATVLEIELLRILRHLIGYPPANAPADSALNAGGAVVFGGAGANFSCLLAAREHLKRRLASEGHLFDPRRTRVLANRPFTHFSLRRSLHMLGLGNRDLGASHRAAAGLDEEVLYDIGTRHFTTDTDDLERSIELVLARGEQIMCVFAVAGDSRFMAFDDIDRMVDIAQRYDIWVHVDACEGGQVLFSPNRRHLMAGAERANSLSMDPHKVLLVPYNVSLFFLREPAWLNYFSGDPATVISQDETSLGGFTPTVNSKGFISLKLLFMLQHWGWQRVADEIDRRHELARRTEKWIDGLPNLRVLNPNVTHNAVAFMYVPAVVHQADPQRLDDLNDLNREIHRRLNMETRYFVHAFPARDDEARIRPDKGSVHGLRMMFGNPLAGWPVVRSCLEEITRIGHEATSERSW